MKHIWNAYGGDDFAKKKRVSVQFYVKLEIDV